MSEERPTFSGIGEENVRQMLRRRADERAMYGGNAVPEHECDER